MRGSLNLGKIFGINVLVHFTFVLIFVYVGYTSYSETQSINSVLYDCMLTLFAFVFVLMHEFGHALAARKIGIETRQILILPIGGMAQLTNMPEKPGDELFVTVCGPLVNLCLVIILIPINIFSNSFHELGALIASGADEKAISFAVWNNIPLALLGINIGLFVFNLIPAFPMDGGRIFRALLAYVLDYKKATLIAVRLGQLIAVSATCYIFFLSSPSEFGFWAVVKLTVLCAFIIILAGMEYRMVKNRYAHSGGLINGNLNFSNKQSANSVSVSDTIGDALIRFHENREERLQVMNNEIVEGILTSNPPMSDINRQVAIANHTYRFNPYDSLGHALNMMEILEIPFIPLPANPSIQITAPLFLIRKSRS
jgi:Zn-dependent protease